MLAGYFYQRGKLEALPNMHTHSMVRNVDNAIADGAVRIRDHGERVAFQGRSKRLVEKAKQRFMDEVRIPQVICQEWPGHYSEVQV